MDKLCCDCGHMDSEISYECDVLLCRMGHFNGVASVELVKDNIRRAATCPDYTTEYVPPPAMTATGVPMVGFIRGN